MLAPDRVELSVRTLCMAGLCGLLACTPLSHPAPRPTPVPSGVSVPAPDSSTPSNSFPQLRWRDEVRRVVASVALRNIATAQFDSAQISYEVTTTSIPGAEGFLQISQQHTEQGHQAVVDSLQTTQASAEGRFLDTSATVLCAVQQNTLSPLQLRFIVPRYAANWPQIDTLQYTTCVRGARASVVAVVTWASPVFDSAREVWNQSLDIKGLVHADSSRVLPLHLSGELTGSGSLILEPVSTKVRELSATMQLELVAKGGTVKQHIQQKVYLEQRAF